MGEGKWCEALQFTPTRDPWTSRCVDGSWNLIGSRTYERIPAYSVITYFPTFNKSGKLPARVKREVERRNIKWSRTEEQEDDQAQQHVGENSGPVQRNDRAGEESGSEWSGEDWKSSSSSGSD